MRKLLFILFGLLAFNAYSQVTVSQEDFDKLPAEYRRMLAPDTTNVVMEKLEETSKAASIGKEIGTAVNETLTAVGDNVIKIAESDVGKTAVGIAVWKLLWKDIVGIIVGLILLGFCIYFVLQAKRKLSTKSDDGGGIVSIVAAAVFFIASMYCIFG